MLPDWIVVLLSLAVGLIYCLTFRNFVYIVKDVLKEKRDEGVISNDAWLVFLITSFAVVIFTILVGYFFLDLLSRVN